MLTAAAIGVTHEAISRQGKRAMPTGSAGGKSSMRRQCYGGGHRASRTRRSAVKAHTRRADWLGRAAEEQPEREQC